MAGRCSDTDSEGLNVKYFERITPNAQTRSVKGKMLYFGNIGNARKNIVSKVFENEISEVEIYITKDYDGSARVKMIDEQNFFDINNPQSPFYENGYAEIMLSTTNYQNSTCFITVKFAKVSRIDPDGIYKTLTFDECTVSGHIAEITEESFKHILQNWQGGTTRELFEYAFSLGAYFSGTALRVVMEDAMNDCCTFTTAELPSDSAAAFDYMCAKYDQHGFHNVKWNLYGIGINFRETWENDPRYQINASDIVSFKLGTAYRKKRAVTIITVTDRGNILYDIGDILNLQFKGQTYRFRIDALRYTMKNGSLTGEIEGNMITT